MANGPQSWATRQPQYASGAFLRAERRPNSPILIGKLATLCATFCCLRPQAGLPRGSTSLVACRGHVLLRSLPNDLAALFGGNGNNVALRTGRCALQIRDPWDASPEFFLFCQTLLGCRFMELPRAHRCPPPSVLVGPHLWIHVWWPFSDSVPATRRHPERDEAKVGAGEGKTKREILGGPAQGGPALLCCCCVLLCCLLCCCFGWFFWTLRSPCGPPCAGPPCSGYPSTGPPSTGPPCAGPPYAGPPKISLFSLSRHIFHSFFPL